MPVQTRAQRRAAAASTVTESECKPEPAPVKSKARSRAKPKPKPKSKAKPKANTKKRRIRLTSSLNSIGKDPQPEADAGTPKKRRRGRSKKSKEVEPPISPSKELARCMNSTLILSEQKDPEPEDNDDDDDPADVQERRRRAIMSLEAKLLTQERKSFDPLLGREAEHSRIRCFVEQQIAAEQGSSFYLCGSPGTGKSATMRAISGWFAQRRRLIWINGMSISNPSAIYQMLAGELLGDATMNPMAAKNALERYLFDTSNAMLMLVVDEMDGLLTSSQQKALYHLFGWAKHPGCRLILIGIANSIDLTERFLPRLKQRRFEPELLIFKPYTKAQLVRILQDRLGAEGGALIDVVAVTLCAQKVAKMYGDVRKCLELLRKALHSVVDTETQKVGFMEMNAVLKKSFQSPLVDMIRALPNQQKTVLVIASILDNANKENLTSLSKLERCIQWFAKKYILPKTSARELTVIIDSLIGDNIMSVAGKGSKHKKEKALAGNAKLQMMVSRDDVQFAVQADKTLSKLFDINAQIPPKFLN